MKTHHWVLIVVGILGILLIVGSIPGTGGSISYAELAENYKADCVAAKGYGNWRGSLGVSLADFCKASGVIKARQEMCSKFPEDC